MAQKIYYRRSKNLPATSMAKLFIDDENPRNNIIIRAIAGRHTIDVSYARESELTLDHIDKVLTIFPAASEEAFENFCKNNLFSHFDFSMAGWEAAEIMKPQITAP